MLNRLTIVLLCLICHSFLFAQAINEKDFVRLPLKNGLTDNYITALQQDNEGYLWIGTDAGLNRYDGNSFQHFFTSSNTLPLLSANIWRIKKMPTGELGILSKGGFQLLNTANFKVRNFVIAKESAFSTYNNEAWDAVVMDDRSVGITTATGFYVFDSTAKMQYRHDAYNPSDVDKKSIRYGRDIFRVSDKEYLMYVNPNGLALYNSKEKIFGELEIPTSPWRLFMLSPGATTHAWITKTQISPHEFLFINLFSDTIVYHDLQTKRIVFSKLPIDCEKELNFQSRIVAYDQNNFIINGGTQGLYRLYIDRKTGVVTGDPKKYFPNHKINCALYDKNRRLWLGTSNGLIQEKMAPGFLQAYIYSTEKFEDDEDGLFLKTIRYKDKLYVTRYSRNTGLVVFDTTTMKPVKVLHFYGKNNLANEVNAMQMYYPDTFWLHTGAGMLWLDTKTYNYGKVTDDKRFPKQLDEFSTLAPLRKDGDAWMCRVLEGKIGRYVPATRQLQYFSDSTNPAIPFRKVKMITYDSYGDVWIGGHSLARWNYKKNAFDTVISTYAGKNKYNENILVLQADEKGSLWFHNPENGLIQYRIKENAYSVYTTADGLMSDRVDALSPVRDNFLWVANRKALQHMDLVTKKIRSFDLPDSFIVKKFGSVPIYIDTVSGWGYLIGKNELVRFPYHINTSPDLSGALRVQSLTINNDKLIYETNKPLKFSFNENNLSINFTILDYEDENYVFAYKLKNTDNWITIGSQRNLLLADLPAGKYEISLRATGKSGVIKTTALSFVIRPPFWRSAWFITLAGILMASLVYYIYRRRIHLIRQRADLDREVAQIEMKALHTQMNPHFIFNCLNSIKKMILDNDNGKASRYLSKFAQLIRITLNQSTKSFISLKSTIDYLERYLEMEQTRTDQFTSSIVVDEELNPEDIYVPPMLIQPFIENAIWHGSPGEDSKTQINLEFSRQGEDLVCRISDNGVGIDSSLKNKKDTVGHNSLGIANVRQRMQVLNEKYNLHARLTIEDRSQLPGSQQTGTLVTLILSIKTTDV